MASNLLTNPGFENGTTDWGTGQGSLTAVANEPKEGLQVGRFVANGTGNRNLTHVVVPASPGQVFSVEAYMRYATGTGRVITIMCQYLNSSGAQVGNFIGDGVTASFAWQRIFSENTVAPANTANVRVQIRINNSASGDGIFIDDAWLNTGPVVDRAVASALSIRIWNGTQEVPANASYWNGTSEVNISDIVIS